MTYPTGPTGSCENGVPHQGLVCLLPPQAPLSQAPLSAILQKNADGHRDASDKAGTRCCRPRRALVWVRYTLKFFGCVARGTGVVVLVGVRVSVGVELLSPSLCDVILVDLRRPAAARQRFSGRLS